VTAAPLPSRASGDPVRGARGLPGPALPPPALPDPASRGRALRRTQAEIQPPPHRCAAERLAVAVAGDAAALAAAVPGFDVLFDAGGDRRGGPRARAGEVVIVAAVADGGASALDLVRALRRDPADGEAGAVCVLGSQDPGLRAAVLRAGADDCVSLPVDALEIRARCLAVARRVQRVRPPDSGPTVELPGIRVSLGDRRIVVDGRAVRLPPVPTAMLFHLVKAAGTVIPRERLVWLAGSRMNPQAVHVHVHQLRDVLAGTSMDGALRNVRGIGYCLTVDGSAPPRRRRARREAAAR